MFLAGVLFASVWWLLYAWWFLERDDGGKIIADRFWLENEDRWLSLRNILLEELEHKRQ